MYRNRKTAAIFVVAAALVLALIFAVGHSRAATRDSSSDKTTATSEPSTISDGNGAGADVAVKGGQTSGGSHSTGQGGNGATGTAGGSTTTTPPTTTPPTTTPPGGGGHRPPFRPPSGEVGGDIGGRQVSDPGSPTSPPGHGGGGTGSGCVHQPKFLCP